MVIPCRTRLLVAVMEVHKVDHAGENETVQMAEAAVAEGDTELPKPVSRERQTQ